MGTLVEAGIFSPRWGHEDIYKFQLTRDAMVIRHGARTVTCTWRDNHDPEWSGPQSLDDIMRNDSIYAPEILPDLFEHAWKSWRNGELNDEGVAEEIHAVVDWLNKVTDAKPQTEFWRKYF